MMANMSTKQDIQAAHVSALTDRMVADIRRRGLVTGERYLTTAEVSRMLGVRKAMAGRAIRRLAEREILIPRPRTGTFVGPGLEKQTRSRVRAIYVLLAAGHPTSTHWHYQPFVEGIRSTIPEINVQLGPIMK